jgi:hypothetical protein
MSDPENNPEPEVSLDEIAERYKNAGWTDETPDSKGIKVLSKPVGGSGGQRDSVPQPAPPPRTARNSPRETHSAKKAA